MQSISSSSVLVFALSLAACGAEAPSHSSEGGPYAEVELDLTLGPDVISPDDAPSVLVAEVLPMPDGSVWVLDRMSDRTRIRRFDATGTPLGEVGGTGVEPGSYVDARSLTRMPDGNVVMVDPFVTGRFSVFGPDGTLIDVPRSRDSTVWHDNGLTRVDDQGRLWILTREGMVPPASQLPAFFTVTGLDAVTVDTVHLPSFPEVDARLVEVPGFGATRSFRLPYEPTLSWDLAPEGRFVYVRGDQYEVRRFGAENGDRDATEVIAGRDLAPVPVGTAERGQLRDVMRARLDTMRFGADVEIPGISDTKPPVRDLRYASDGRLMVHVAVPSTQSGGLWVEPNGWDVFERDGSFTARVVVPHDVEIFDLEGDALWGVRTDQSGAQSVVRYRVAWPESA